MNEKRYGKKVDDVDDTIIHITEDGNDFAWFLSDDYLDEQVDKIVQRLNELSDENDLQKLQNQEIEITLLNNQLAYNDLQKENEQLKEFKKSILDYIVDEMKFNQKKYFETEDDSFKYTKIVLENIVRSFE